ncbi:MAG: hypothetical protein A2908_03600 [Candidatus Staskawiczbacteria bacterium RIFCSPLOWO2_01_FULL_38_12b]|uniref:Uncharacterized protein n=1 Tax=Candidatus Staskawiczbacteria bacterium RIFCSPLOWO2_01_FULL_38_12b TaxID=1802214 RepID=A0A1G2ICX4_9BACT|nr:MAG: hypothetical protein A2908_03600 [Candidatus Staskawiczbacteria bacterium RIFCSPLOWO2_01_FULL_38_12b]
MATRFQKPTNSDVTPKELMDSIKRIDAYMIGVMIVVVFGFLTLLVTVSGLVIDAYRFKSSSYEVLIGKTNLINQKLDDLNKEKNDSIINNLQNQIDNLKQKNPYLK